MKLVQAILLQWLLAIGVAYPHLERKDASLPGARNSVNLGCKEVTLVHDMGTTMSVAAAFQEYGLVPDVLYAGTAPTKLLESGVKVELGTELTPTQTELQPTVTWPTEEGAFYVLMMLDPDAPSRADPKFREWRHWLVGNIPGCDVSNGETIVTYVGPTPPQGTGLHRYVFLVYKQTGKLTFDEPKIGLVGAGRSNSRAWEFAAKYNHGNPVAGNFMEVQYDDRISYLFSRLK